MLDSGGSEGGSPQLYQALQAQKAASSSGSATGHGAPGGLGGLGGSVGSAQAPAPAPLPPREVGSVPEELLQRPVQDIQREVTSWFDLNKLVGINTEDTQETKNHKQELHSRYQQLDAEQQQYVQKRLRSEQERKHRLEQEHRIEAEKKQAEAANDITPPPTPYKGAVDPNAAKSRSQRMAQTVQQNRQSFNKVQSSG